MSGFYILPLSKSKPHNSEEKSVYLNWFTRLVYQI